MTFESWSVPASPLAHMTGRAAIPAVALFLAGIGAALGGLNSAVRRAPAHDSRYR